MNNILTNIEDIDIVYQNRDEVFKLLESIEDFIVKKTQTNWQIDIYKLGTNVFNSLPQTKFASIYILSNDDFLFEHKFTLPIEYENESMLIYDYLINKQFVGGVLENNHSQFFTIQDFEFKNDGILIPLSVSTRILGLVLISNNDVEFLNNPIVKKLLNLFSSLLATYIENCDIIRHLDSTQSLLEQKIAQRTLDLTQSQRELKTIIDSVLAGIIVYDENNKKIIKVNPIAQELIQLSEENLIGKNILDFLSETELKNNKQDFNQIKKAYESVMFDSSKTIIPILRTTNRLFLANRNVIIESFVDISEIKKYEDALKDSNASLEIKIKNRTEDLQLLVQKLKIEVAERERAEKELKRLFEKEKELNELKSKFVNLVSHEFRTPLTIIKSSTQMFQKFGEKLNRDEKDYYYRRIIKTVDYLNDLIENSLFIGKNDNKNYDVNLIKTDLNKFFNDLIFDFKNSIDKKREIKVINNDKFEVYTDERLLFLICNNLLSNAHKYSDIDKEIIVEYYLDNNNLIIKFTDFGIGITEDDKNKIFNQFFRGTNIGTIVGTGLGLAVVKESVDKLKGKISVSSEIGKGTSFELNIPVKTYQLN